MVMIALGVVATFLVVFFFIIYEKADRTVILEIVYARAWECKFGAEKAEADLADLKKKNAKYHTLSERKIKRIEREKNKIIKTNKDAYEKYMLGKGFSFTDALVVFGYEFLTVFGVDANNTVYKKMVSMCEQSGYVDLEREMETGGKKNSSVFAYYLMGKMMAFSYVGLPAGILLGGITRYAGNDIGPSIAVGFVTFAACVIAGYLSYDAINSVTQKRKEEFERDFPNALSKITLLIIAGLNITKALEHTVADGTGIVNAELGLVMDETNRGETLEKAFIRMQNRCKNDYLDRLVALITKSYVMGNTNLADSLMSINSDCWLEKKHSVRRMAEVIQSKLFIPTLLMFVGILIVIIVPAMSSFGGF